MSPLLVNIGIVLLFVLVGGFFAAAEMALVSLRESQISQLAQRGTRGRAVLRLHNHPNRFLSAVQIGVTLSGFLSAAFGASTIAKDVAPVLADWGLPEGLSDGLALVGITMVIVYLSLVLGELAPKRIALQRAEGVALLSAPAIELMAKVSTPLIWLLSRSTDVVVRLAGGDPKASREQMSELELRELVA
ncbi:MAG: CNNM domain-containing protein, partial [Actinomycetia bacterium]|nr:CNNM domain-containing protein [Actinomycetes bacterium]